MSESESYYYYTVEQSAIAEYKDRGSRFIAATFPVDSPVAFKKIHQMVKQQHPKAHHHCFAYRIGVDGAVFRSGDDGEPAGTAGKPILGQIISKNLTNVAVIVTRYFGGILLGTSGLIQAYKQSASFALQSTPVVRKQIETSFLLECDYLKLDEVLRIIQSNGGNVIQKQIELFCSIQVAVPAFRSTEIRSLLNALPGITLRNI
ncbi:MAG: IMPACT family protein [Bacteroidetes bacterium]|nr:IMPACT family protein [Bacteroidota bacterium]